MVQGLLGEVLEGKKDGGGVMSAGVSVTTLSPEPDDRRQLRRAVIASTVGTTIEWYDFFLYSTVTGLVFGQLYFPKSDPVVGTLQAFGIYAVGFVARPVGAAIFGHYGDRIGRKSALISTLLLMGISTFLVAFVPPYAQIGIWGAVLLVILRFVQGVGVGGEWGGSVLMSMEWTKTNAHRGFVASWPQFGVPAGLFLANLAVLAFSQISGARFLTWGWRIPFFLSFLLVGIGLYIRLNILETPVFSRLISENKIERTPILEVIKRRPRQILLSAVARMGEQAPFYIFTAFVFTYGTKVLNVSRDLLLTGVLTASALSFFTIPFSGYLSDRIGRRRMYMIGAAVTGAFGFIYFALLNTAIPGWIFLAVVLSLIPHGMMYGPQAALIAESFPGRLRYSGASLGYQLASIIAGGPAPLIAAWLFAKYGSGYAIAGYILLCAILSFISTAMLKDYTGRDISQGYGRFGHNDHGEGHAEN
jgi:MFS family permease